MLHSLLRGPVTFDSKSFLVDGQRLWLHCAEIHYFRHPAELWRDALVRARGAGCNTISTYVPWNMHEPVEGQADFSGGLDLARYLDLCRELGLYCIVRPGPYICSEWDGGGIPGWVFAKPGIRTRDDDPEFGACVRRWFERLLPLVAKRQVSRGGPVILVQNENEYGGGWNESTRSYTRKINKLFRGLGLQVPIIACNAHGCTPTTVQVNYSTAPEDQMLWPEMVVTFNWGPGAEPLRDLRQKQPNAPLLMTEYWAGPQQFWGKPLSDWCATPEYARSMLEFASVGCQVTYYMFDGGTNFGYWAGANFATSYQSNYPVREGGVLWDKYYRLNPVNHFISQFGAFLAESEEVEDKLGIRVPASTRLVVRRCPPEAHLLFVTDAGSRPATELRLPGSRTPLHVPLPSIRGLVLPYHVDLLDGVRLDYTNLGLLGLSPKANCLVLWGVAGTEAIIRVNGRTETFTVPGGRARDIEVGRAPFCIVDEALAGRSWFVKDRIVFGPDLVDLSGNGRDILARCSIATPGIQVLDEKGTLSEAELPAIPPTPAPPALAPWRPLPCPEPAGDGEAWQPLADGPVTHEKLGRHYGYVWYRAEFNAGEETTLPLFVPRCATRFTVYSNGLYCGTAGELTRFVEFCGYRHPADAFQQDQVMVPVRAGRNVIVILSDNLGRHCGGHPDPQGLNGPVYLGATRVPLNSPRLFAPVPIAKDAFKVLYAKWFRKPEPLPGVDFRLRVPPHTDAFLTIPCGLRNLVLTVNGRYVGAMGGAGQPYGTLQFPEWAAGKELKIRLQVQGSGASAPGLENIQAFVAPRAAQLSHWAWKAGGEWPLLPTADAAADTAAVAAAKPETWGGLVPEQPRPGGGTHKTWPTYWATNFVRPQAAELPLFLSIGKLHKGQLFLNGRNLGRFWQVGGHWQGNGVQSLYYLPQPWLQEQNTLVAFEEYGLPPDGTALAWGTPDNCVWTKV